MSTRSLYQLCVETHLIPVFGSKFLIKEAEVQDFVFAKCGDGCSICTVKQMVGILKMIVKYASKHAGWPYPLWEIRYPRGETHRRIQLFTENQQKRLLSYVINDKSALSLGIFLALCTGMRIGEVCALRWKDLNLSEGSLFVSSTLSAIFVKEGKTWMSKNVLSSPKTLTSKREIPLIPQLVDALKRRRTSDDEYAFVLTNSRKPVGVKCYRNYYYHLLMRLNLPKKNFHSLRHTFATRCIENKYDLKTISTLLGHSRTSITLDLYVHPNTMQKRRCLQQMYSSLMKS